MSDKPDLVGILRCVLVGHVTGGDVELDVRSEVVVARQLDGDVLMGIGI